MFFLQWSAIFFVIAIITGLFGFTKTAKKSPDIARFLFFMFIMLFIIALLVDLGILI